MKFIKIIFSIVILLLVIVVIGIGSLVYFVDPNKMKPVLAAEVMNKSGYQLTINGNLSWSFYPRFGIKVEDMSLSVPKQKPFVALSDVRIGTNLWQLLHGSEKLRGKVTIAKIVFANLQLQNARIGINWENKILSLQPITAHLYGGSLTGSAHGRELFVIPKWDFDFQANGIQLQALLNDASNPNKRINLSGVGQFNLLATTQGRNREQIINHLNGSMQFVVNHGVVYGIDLNYLVQAADALISKQPLAVPTHINQTSFESLTGSVMLENGTAKTSNLLLTSSEFTTRAKGEFNLLSEMINLKLRIVPQHPMKINWQIPVLIEGSLTRPTIQLDAFAIGKWVVQNKLNEVKEKVEEEIKDHINGSAGELLQNLLGK